MFPKMLTVVKFIYIYIYIYQFINGDYIVIVSLQFL